jgi:hypothetical protein
VSRRDYIAVAVVLRGAALTERQRDDLVGRFSDLFAADNPRFDADRFALACGSPSALSDPYAVPTTLSTRSVTP